VVTGRDGVGLCGFDGLHGDGAEFSFSGRIAEYQIGYEFRDAIPLILMNLLSLLPLLLSVWLLSNKIPTV